MHELIYGIRQTDGKIISIDEVPNDATGVKCACVCAACAKPLQACSLTGKVNHYFRHHIDTRDGSGGGGCNAMNANETALHLMAKQIIAEEKTIFVPAINIAVRTANITDLPQNIINYMPRYKHHEAMSVVGESVDLEKSVENFKPDAIINTKRGKILVEFLVRHGVDMAKKGKVEQYGSAMVEVDLSEYVETPITHEELRDIIVSQSDRKEWIYYPLSEAALQKARAYYENLGIVKDYREELRKQERKAAARERGRSKIKKMFEPANYAAELDRLRDDDAFQKTYNQYHQSHWYHFGGHFRRYNTVPFFVDIPITGEMIFQCDRRIWQSILFNRYIYGRKEDYASFSIENFFPILKDDYSIKVDYDLSYKLPDPLHEDKELRLGQDVIRTYFSYLETIGFIITENPRGGYEEACWKTVQARRTLVPPDQPAADYLLDALKSVDRHSPDINSLIRDKMSAYYEEKQQQKKEAEAEAARQEAERKAAEKANYWLSMYDIGLQDVEKFDFDAPMNRYDRFDMRWFRCNSCQKIKRREEMLPAYQFGRGLCWACTKSQSTDETE